jgi:chemotaxis signal transduction protein
MSRKWPILLPAEALEQLSDEEFWSYANELALLAPTDAGTEAETLPEEYLRCQLCSGDYLIPLTALQEVLLPPQDVREAYPYALLPTIPVWMAGVFAWRGETIAVIDLDAYLFGDRKEAPLRPLSDQVAYENEVAPHVAMNLTSALLIAGCSGPPIGLLVPTVGSTTIPAEAPVLDLRAILEDVVQQIKDACPS